MRSAHALASNGQDLALPSSQLYINGAFVPPSTSETFSVYNPSTSALVGHAAASTLPDVLTAIKAAETAQPAWEATSPSERRRILNRAADILETEEIRQKFVELETAEMGAAGFWAIGDSIAAALQLREAAAVASSIRGETFPSSSVFTPGASVMIQRRAIGVVFGIAPWNSAANLASRAVAIPLICGNTVVLKSSEVCPATHTLFAQVMHEAGLPPGCLNLLHVRKEDAPTLVKEIIAHPSVKHVNFTGSDRVGRIIAAEAGKHMKPVVLELGGKSAAVVLSDANVKVAARGIIAGAMLNSGQICMSTERVIVQRSVSEELIAELTSLASRIPTTPSPESILGSGLFSSASALNIESLLTDATSKGAEIIVGDGKVQGNWIRPTIVNPYAKDMKIWEEETFGPVIGITVVDTVDDAIAAANNTEFTLVSSLWTTSLDGIEIASRIRVGQVHINGMTFHPEPCIEIHGIGGRSGYGKFNIQNFTQERIIVVNKPNARFPVVDQLL